MTARCRRAPGSRVAVAGIPRIGRGARRQKPHRVLELVNRVSVALESVVDPDVAAWTVLVAFTAGEGLGFNRAYFLLADGDEMRGAFGVGPRSQAEAREIWASLRHDRVTPLETIAHPDNVALAIERERNADVLGRLSDRGDGKCKAWRHAFVARCGHPLPCVGHWLEVLGSRLLVVVPLMAGDRPWGVILADNFVTQAPIYVGTLNAAELLGHTLRASVERARLIARLGDEQRRRAGAEHAETLIETARSLAHDLKNPLALAGGLAADLAAEPPRDADIVTKRLGMVSKAISRAEARLAQLIDGLANRALSSTVEAVEIGPVVNRVVDAFRSLATSQGVRLVCYRPARPLTALASVPSLERCVENLIGNALQALVPGTGEIQVAVLSADREVRIEVVDSGPLLPVALRGDPFAGGVSTRRGGSGLGLASVRAQIQAMGGQVEYDENQRGWTRFSIILRRST